MPGIRLSASGKVSSGRSFFFFLYRKRGRPTTFRQPPKLSPKEILNGLVSAGDVPLKISFESGWLAPAEVVRLYNVPILIARITQLTSGNPCETGLTRIAQLTPGNPCQQNVAHLCRHFRSQLEFRHALISSRQPRLVCCYAD